MSRLTKVDHVTYVVRPESIRKWAWFYMEVMGGKMILRKDDTNPGEKSSMMLWCIDFGEFGIALVAGIDREEKSHVTAYVEKHGDHSVQHVAFLVQDLQTFRTQVMDLGVNLLGPILQRHDGFGYVRQVFARGYHDSANPAEVGFPEFVERPLHKDAPFPEVSFSREAGTNLYRQAQHAMDADERKPLVDFSKMPAGWEPSNADR
jgi:hypothetical protein